MRTLSVSYDKTNKGSKKHTPRARIRNKQEDYSIQVTCNVDPLATVGEAALITICFPDGNKWTGTITELANNMDAILK